jgi:KUP system potassium uptake protein
VARAENIRTALESALRIPRTGIFFSSRRSGYPSAFLHNLKHNMVVHERTIFLALEFLDVPYLTDENERLDIERLDAGIWRVTARFGFREDPDISRILRQGAKCGLQIDLEMTSFFTSKAEVVSVTRPKWHSLRRGIFIWMLQNSPTIADYIRLPPDRVVELRTQVGV